jgi:carboxymethylenebutenolidase
MKMTKKNPYDQKLLDLYDGYAHGLISRREFLDRAVIFTTGGLTAAGLLSSLSPNYVLAQQVLPNDKKIVAEYKEYSSPGGG